MGISGIGVWQLLIVLVIVLLLFGSKRLGSLGGDLGRAVSGFRNAINDSATDKESPGETVAAKADTQ